MTSILKVTEIQDPTNSNSALTIDTSGRLGQGSPVGFRAKVNPSQSISSGGTRLSQFALPGAGGFNTDGAGGTVLNVSTGVMTIPVNGYYFYSIEGRLDSFSGSYYYFDWYATDSSGNSTGTVYARTLTQGGGNTAYDDFTATGTLYLTSGLFLAWFYQHSGDANVTVNNDTYVSLFKVG